jgi:hypothetical protein
MTPKQQRQARAYQAAHRGSGRSYKTELENALLLLAWEAAELSEGQISRILDVDRLEIRKMRQEAIDAGMELAREIKKGMK